MFSINEIRSAINDHILAIATDASAKFCRPPDTQIYFSGQPDERTDIKPYWEVSYPIAVNQPQDTYSEVKQEMLVQIDIVGDKNNDTRDLDGFVDAITQQFAYHSRFGGINAKDNPNGTRGDILVESAPSIGFNGELDTDYRITLSITVSYYIQRGGS